MLSKNMKLKPHNVFLAAISMETCYDNWCVDIDFLEKNIFQKPFSRGEKLMGALQEKRLDSYSLLYGRGSRRKNSFRKIPLTSYIMCKSMRI